MDLANGSKKAKPTEFPHVVLLGYDGKNKTRRWLCSGSLISENFVLTAAHCLYYSGKKEVRYVRIRGSNDAHLQEFGIANIIKHPDYAPPSHYHDIALLKLNGSAKLNSYIRPACLYTNSLLKTTRFVATSWKSTCSGSSEELLKVDLGHFSHRECNYSYRNHISRKLQNGIVDSIQICAGSKINGVDTCQGDSGGPLHLVDNEDQICKYKIIGITSFGRSCGVSNIPGVYTRVSYYIKWIEDTVWP